MTAPTVEVRPADLGGCGHYRLIWAASALYYAGADVNLVLPDTPDSSFEVAADLDATVRTRTSQLGRLLTVPDADVVVLQRPLTRQLVHVIRELQAAGRAVVVEVDDDFATIDPQNIAWRTVNPRYNAERNWHHLAEACRLADLVTVTTPALAARYGAHGRVRIIPNYVPGSYLHILPAGHDGTRVGWSGTVDTHPHDLQVTRGAVGRVLHRHGLRFHLIGSGRITAMVDGELVENATDVRIIRNLGLHPDDGFAHTDGWLHLEQYPRALAELDVGIVPLAPSAFNEAKSWLKGLELAAVGVPFIASPTGPYRELVAMGAGLLADRPRRWESLLERLITDLDYRDELADAGRRVAGRLIVDNHLDQWANAWAEAANNAARRRKHTTTTSTPKGNR